MSKSKSESRSTSKKSNKKLILTFSLIILLAGVFAPIFSPVYADWTDVPYAAKSSAQKLDIYLPSTGSGPFPVIVAIHGGGFMMGDKADEKAAITACNSGYAVASINYRLSGEAIFPAQIQDVKAAIRFLRANASTYNLNPDKIATWGGSAGGNLASLAGTSGGVSELEDLTLGNESYSSTVQAVVDWFGPINFSTMDTQFTTNEVPKKTPGTTDGATSPESKLIGAEVGTNPALVAKANPETYISADDPPFFIQHGTLDGNVPTQQSRDFYANLIKVLPTDKVNLTILEGAGHGGDAFNSAENVAKVVEFLDKYLKISDDEGDAKYNEGYEAGKKYCIDNPSACGINCEEPVCSQVITYAKPPSVDCWIMFPTSCGIPSGWETSNATQSNLCGTSNYDAGKQACIDDPLSCGIAKYLIFSSNTNPVLPSGTSVNVYGNAEINRVTLKSGASAKLINFVGNNEVTIQADSTLFNVSRSGASVTFKDSDGTVLSIPATKTPQLIIFNDITLTLVIKENQVMLENQIINLTPSPIL